MRQEFTKKTKLAAWTRCLGRCEKCTAKLMTGYIEYDHDLSDALGGSNDLDNCIVLCRGCHRAKTDKIDIPVIAKSNRVRDKHFGIKTKKYKWPSRSF